MIATQDTINTNQSETSSSSSSSRSVKTPDGLAMSSTCSKIVWSLPSVINMDWFKSDCKKKKSTLWRGLRNRKTLKRSLLLDYMSPLHNLLFLFLVQVRKHHISALESRHQSTQIQRSTVILAARSDDSNCKRNGQPNQLLIFYCFLSCTNWSHRLLHLTHH